MHNFDFLNKTELSYILNNEEEFGPALIAQVVDYCRREGLQKDKIKAKKAEWNIHYHWLNVNVLDECMLISKTEDAKASEVNKYSFLIVALALMIGGSFIWFIGKEVHDFEFFYFILIGLPISIAMFVGSIIQKRRVVKKLNQHKNVIVYSSSKVEFFVDNDKIVEEDLKAVNLFCSESEEAGSKPSAVLELKLINKKVIGIDSGNNYLELLKCGNDIAKFSKKQLNVWAGDSPNKDKIEL